MKNIAIIGAGAAGLFLCRKLSGKRDLQVYVFERCQQPGTKLRASGGGKANIFNAAVSPGCYNRPEFIAHLLQKVSPATLYQEFTEMGLLMITDEENRVYPMSLSSKTVVDVLQETLDNIHVELCYEVAALFNKNGKWHVNDYPVAFDNVVLTSGSAANILPAQQDCCSRFLQPLRLKTVPLRPSLVGFVVNRYPKMLSGCRARAMASLFQKDRLVHREAGEVMFKDDGISGIVILNLSAYYNRLESQNNCQVLLDFVYQDERFDAEAHLHRFLSFKGVLHPKLCALYEKKPFDPRRFRLDITGTYGLSLAQVCHGGIDLCELDEDFSLKRYPGIYAAGELLDVDGICGGYNLFFAFASALVAAQSIMV